MFIAVTVYFQPRKKFQSFHPISKGDRDSQRIRITSLGSNL